MNKQPNKQKNLRITSPATTCCRKPELGEMLAQSAPHQPSPCLPLGQAGGSYVSPAVGMVGCKGTHWGRTSYWDLLPGHLGRMYIVSFQGLQQVLRQFITHLLELLKTPENMPIPACFFTP